MRRNRVIWICLWILSIVGISFFGGNISYGFFAMVTIVPVVSMVYLLCVYFLFHMYQKVDTRQIVAAQNLPFYFTLVNDYLLVFAGIKVKFYTDFSTIMGLDDDLEYELMPGDDVTKQTSILCKYRGEYEVGVKTFIVQDFFRLFSVSYHNREPLRVIVRPQIVHLEDLNRIDLNIASRDMDRNDATPDVLTRPYVPGDDPRKIHWKATAKTGELMVRGRIGEEKQDIGIVLSTYRKEEKQEQYLPVENKMLEIVLALTYFFANKNISVLQMYKTSELMEEYVSGIQQFDTCYEHISGVEFSAGRTDEVLVDALGKGNSLMQCRMIFLVVQNWSETLESLLYRLRQNNIHVAICYVGNEIPQELLALQMPGLEYIKISPEDDLREVLR